MGHHHDGAEICIALLPVKSFLGKWRWIECGMILGRMEIISRWRGESHMHDIPPGSTDDSDDYERTNMQPRIHKRRHAISAVQFVAENALL